MPRDHTNNPAQSRVKRTHLESRNARARELERLRRGRAVDAQLRSAALRGEHLGVAISQRVEVVLARLRRFGTHENERLALALEAALRLRGALSREGELRLERDHCGVAGRGLREQAPRPGEEREIARVGRWEREAGVRK